MTPEEVKKVLDSHWDVNAVDGIMCDGEVAWLHCRCGWRLNYVMPEDDIRHAQRAWNAHVAEQIAWSAA